MDFDSSERKPKLQEVLARARRHGAIHTTMPAVVVKYDPAKRRVDVKPLIKEAFLDEEDARQVRSWQVITNVPIVWPGGGGYVLTFPLSDGTTVIDGAIAPATIGEITCSERSIDRWLSGHGGEVDPEIDHNHDLTDAIFTPELRSFGASYPATPADHAVLGKDGGVQIHLRSTGITIGDEAASSFIARADKVLTELGKIASAMGTVVSHTHAVSAGVAIVSTNIGAGYSASPVAASQGKVQ